MRRNRILDRHTFLSRKQRPSESLHQFWNVLSGLAAKCGFENQTERLVYDIFILNMSNKQVQEKLRTEPKDSPLDAFQFAITFVDGLKRQKTYCNISQETRVKEEPVFAISGNRQNNREYWRCGTNNLTLNLVKIYKAPDAKCNYGGRKGHLERVCNQKRKDNTQQLAKSRANGNSVQLVHQDQDDGNDYSDLNVEGEEEISKPYYMEGPINRNTFKAMINSGSPVTIFAIDEFRKSMNTLQVREMMKGENYVDIKGKQLSLLGYVSCQLQEGDRIIRKARILVSSKGSRSIIDRERQSSLRYMFEPVTEGELKSIQQKKTKNFVKKHKKSLGSLTNCLQEMKNKNTSSKNNLEGKCKNNSA